MKNSRYWFYWYFWNHITHFYYDTKLMIGNHFYFHKAIKGQFLDEADGIMDFLYWKMKHLYKSHKEWDDYFDSQPPSPPMEMSKEESEHSAHYAVQHRKGMAAMRVCIKILERLRSGWHENVIYDKIFPDYKVDMETVKCEGKAYSECKITHTGADINDVMAADDQFNSVRKRDRKLLFQLIHEYMDGWWH